MNMNINKMLPYVTYLLVAIGVMAFLVSVITQVIKELPGLKEIPTAVVVIALSGTLPCGPGCPDGVAGTADHLVYDFRMYDCGIYRGPGCHGRLGTCGRDLEEN